MLYIDGFAGPGRYLGGEDGSPVIALHAAIEQQVRISANLTFHFIEQDADRADHLQGIIEQIKVPGNFACVIHHGQQFEQAFSEILLGCIGQYGRLPPTFALIDPFGWTGVSFETIQKILGYQSCEVLITFMYGWINRFIGLPDQESNVDRFFGTIDWRQCKTIRVPTDRDRFLHDLYATQLRQKAGTRYVRSFQMRNDRDVIDYYLFFATNSESGLKRMKEAMWNVDKSGEFRFSDATDPSQLVLFEDTPNFDTLKSLLMRRFSGESPTIRSIEEFVLTDTPFRETHFKRQILRPMEMAEPPEIAIIGGKSNRKRGTFGDPALRIRFLGESI